MVPQPQINLLRGWPNPSLIFPAATFLLSGASSVLNDHDRSTSAFLYGADAGDLQLREQLALWHSRFYEWPPGRSHHGKSIDAGPEGKYETGQKIAASRYAISGGASQGLACILQVFTDPVATKSVWFVEPAYMLAFRIFEDAGLSRRKFRGVGEGEGGEGVDVEGLKRGLEEVEEAARKDDQEGKAVKPARPWAKHYRHIIYAVPTFSNPSSTVMSLRRRNELVLVAREFDALLITDDVYDQLFWLAEDGRRGNLKGSHVEGDTTFGGNGFAAVRPTYEQKEEELRAVMPRMVDIDAQLHGGTLRAGADGFGNAVSNGSFSKICGPGLRTGWIEGTEKFAYGFSQAGSNRSGGAASHLTATFLAELVKNGHVQKHIRQCLRPSYAARYRRLLCAIERDLEPLGVKVKRPQATTQRSQQQPHVREQKEQKSALLDANGTGIPETEPAPTGIAGGYFLWLTLPPGVDAVEVASVALEQENLVVAQGSMFEVPREDIDDAAAAAAASGEGENHSRGRYSRNLRLCIAWEDSEMLDEGIGRLKEAIERVICRSTCTTTTGMAENPELDGMSDGSLPYERKSIHMMEKFR